MQEASEDPLILKIFFGDRLWKSIPKKLYFKGLREVPHTLSEEEYKKCFSEREEKLAKTSALYMLSRRSLFVNELSSKLLKMGYGTKAIDAAVQYCEQIGALAEDKKLMYLIQKAMERGKGELHIRMHLKKYKIDEEKISKCFEELSFDPRIAIRKLLDKQLKKYNLQEILQKRKVVLFLQRRGFQLEDIFSVINAK